MAKFSAKLVVNFRRSLKGDFRAAFTGENRQKHFPPKLHRKFHHRTSLLGSGLSRALRLLSPLLATLFLLKNTRSLATGLFLRGGHACNRQSKQVCEMFGGPPVIGLEDWLTAILSGEEVGLSAAQILLSCLSLSLSLSLSLYISLVLSLSLAISTSHC